MLSYPELIHASENKWILRRESVPLREIGHRLISGKTASEVMQHAVGQVEAQELELVLAEKVVDLWQRKLMLLDVE